MDQEKCFRCAALPVAGFIEGNPACHPCLVAFCTPAVYNNPSGRLCGRCSSQLADSDLACLNCGYIEPGLISRGNSMELDSPASSCWTCVCGYQYNIKNVCQLCSRPPSIPQFLPQANSSPALSVQRNCSNCGNTLNPGEACLNCNSGSPSKSQDQQLRVQGCWTCPKCCFSLNSQLLDTCQNCGISKSVDSQQWMCPNCSQENSETSEICVRCRLRHGWIYYLEFKKVPLTSDKKEWVCRKCAAYTPVTEPACSRCGKQNKVIVRGLGARGNEHVVVTAVRSFLHQVKKQLK